MAQHPTSGLTGPRRLSATHLFQFHFSSQIFPGWQCSQPDLPFKARVGRWCIAGEILMVEVYYTLRDMLYGCRCSCKCKTIVGTIMCICFRYFGFGKSGVCCTFSFLSTVLCSVFHIYTCCLPTAVSGKSSCIFGVGPLQIPCQLGLKLRIQKYIASKAWVAINRRVLWMSYAVRYTVKHPGN